MEEKTGSATAEDGEVSGGLDLEGQHEKGRRLG